MEKKIKRKHKMSANTTSIFFQIRSDEKTYTVVGTECALSSKVVDEIAEFILHTDLFNC